MKMRSWLVGLLCLALLGAMVAGLSVRTPGGAAIAAGPPEAAPPPAATAGEATNYAKSLSKAFREAARKVLPAVVMIQTSSTPVVEPGVQGDSNDEDEAFGDLFRNNPELRRFFRDAPSMPHGRTTPHPGVSGIGSGMIIDSSGIILTNNHVVEGAGKITVRLHDGREFAGVDVKRDPKTDVAVLRIKDAGKLVAARLGDSDAMDVGDWVLALGDPFGLEGTVTAGIISAKDRGLGIAARESFLQTDAAINPGNSGGPLLDANGSVIGIVTAASSSAQDMGFAVPISQAKQMIAAAISNA
jgi:serine protease Do